MPNTAEIRSTGRKRASAKADYVRLLTKFAPVAIETEAENERALTTADELMRSPERSEAESSLLKLLAVLIGNFEAQHHSMGESSPLDTLKELMNAREMTPKDLWPIFGSKGIASEVLSGKRGISKEAAKRLGAEFHVSPGLFI